MIAIDANILSLLINENASVPRDFRTNRPIERVPERLAVLISRAEEFNQAILIPTPALAEALVPLAPQLQDHILHLQQSAAFRIRGFGTRACIEHALRVSKAMSSGDKRDFVAAPWTKVNFDRQIVAIALVEGVSQIYRLTPMSTITRGCGGSQRYILGMWRFRQGKKSCSPAKGRSRSPARQTSLHRGNLPVRDAHGAFCRSSRRQAMRKHRSRFG